MLQVRDLRTTFRTRQGLVKAVDGVDLDIRYGECLGVVGESGSGKSVAFASIMGLVRPPGRIETGSIQFEGRELTTLDAQAMRRLRGREIAMTFQDALTALNPAFTVGSQIIEAIVAYDQTTASRRGRLRRARAQAIEMMTLVGDSRCGEPREGLPAPVLGRHAPADHDRHCARLPSEAADCG